MQAVSMALPVRDDGVAAWSIVAPQVQDETAASWTQRDRFTAEAARPPEQLQVLWPDAEPDPSREDPTCVPVLLPHRSPVPTGGYVASSSRSRGAPNCSIMSIDAPMCSWPMIWTSTASHQQGDARVASPTSPTSHCVSLTCTSVRALVADVSPRLPVPTSLVSISVSKHGF
jgi:hypothetical protein